MDALTEVFLGNLKFRHHRGLPNLVENRSVWFTGLEVEGTVLCLQDNILTEESVLRLELSYCLLHTVLTLMLVAIDETTPHHNAAIWFEGIGKHIGTVGMSAVVVAGTWLSFGVRLYEETAEVGDDRVNLLNLVLPPLRHGRVKRVSRFKAAKNHRCGEVDGQIGLYSVGTEDIRYGFHLIYIYSGEHLRRRVHIVKHRTVDTYGGVGTGIFGDVGTQRRRALITRLAKRGTSRRTLLALGNLVPKPYTISGISPLNASVEIIPVIKYSDVESRVHPFPDGAAGRMPHTRDRQPWMQ